MDISVIIVSWNTKGLLDQCLTSITAAPPSHSVEIIVVDNGSTDGSIQLVQDKFPEVKLIQNRENLGFAKANNLGFKHSSGRYVSLVNSDVKVFPGCFDVLADYLDENPTVGNAGPRVLNGDLTLQSSCRNFPTLWNNFCGAVGLARVFKRTRLFCGEQMFFFPHDVTTTVEALSGCFWMLRRSTIEQIGLLDEDFFMYGEDVDWCRRCWSAGWKIAFVPAAEAIHYGGGSSRAQPARFAVAQQSAIFHYWSKHNGTLELLGIKGILFCRQFIRYLFYTVFRYSGLAEASVADARVRTSAACLKALLFGPGNAKYGT